LKNKLTNKSPLVVIARHSEDISWVGKLSYNFQVINKSAVGNTGREAASYLWFICKNYDSLEGEYIFCQANPFDHAADFLEQIKLENRQTFGEVLACDINGLPHHWGGLNVAEIAAALNLPPLERDIRFVAGSQFRVSSEQILTRSIDFYRNALWIANNHEAYPNAPWILERLWLTIFNIK